MTPEETALYAAYIATRVHDRFHGGGHVPMAWHRPTVYDMKGYIKEALALVKLHRDTMAELAQEGVTDK